METKHRSKKLAATVNYVAIPKNLNNAIKEIRLEIENQGIEPQNIELKHEDELDCYYFRVKTTVDHKVIEYFKENMTEIITEVAKKNKLKYRSKVPFVYFEYIS